MWSKRNRSGVLELDELRRIWTEVTTWRDVFLKFDRDESDFIESSELQQIFKAVGKPKKTGYNL